MPLDNALDRRLGEYSQAELTKLTVPQLKALCKERKIPGYSKLSKQALVLKLVKSGITSDAGLFTGTPVAPGPQAPSGPSVPHTTSPAVAIPARSSATSTAAGGGPTSHQMNGAQSFNSLPLVRTRPSKANSTIPKPQAKSRDRKAVLPQYHQAGSVHTAQTPSSTPRGSLAALPNLVAAPVTATRSNGRADTTTAQDATVPSPSVSMAGSQSRIPVLVAGSRVLSSSSSRDATGKSSARLSLTRDPKRPRQSSKEAMPPPPVKKQRVLTTSHTPNLQSALVQAVLAPEPIAVNSKIMSVAPTDSAVLASSSTVSAKRFKPLVVDTAKLTVSSRSLAAEAVPEVLMATPHSGTSSLPKEQDLSSLDRFVASIPTLHPISMPPSLVHRKRVYRWAVILSGLDNKGRAACMLVSRAFRYAGTVTSSYKFDSLWNPLIMHIRRSLPLGVDHTPARLRRAAPARKCAQVVSTGDDEHVAISSGTRG